MRDNYTTLMPEGNGYVGDGGAMQVQNGSNGSNGKITVRDLKRKYGMGLKSSTSPSPFLLYPQEKEKDCEHVYWQICKFSCGKVSVVVSCSVVFMETSEKQSSKRLELPLPGRGSNIAMLSAG